MDSAERDMILTVILILLIVIILIAYLSTSFGLDMTKFLPA
jgi:hypothetical protein